MEITKRANTDIVLNAFMNHIVIGMKSVSIICVKKILVPLDYLVLWQSGLARQIEEIVVLDQDDIEVLVVVLDQEDIEVLVVVLDQEDIKVLNSSGTESGRYKESGSGIWKNKRYWKEI